MNLALVVRRLSHHGGTERFVEGLARHALQAGHRVDIWCNGADLEIPGVGLRFLSPEGRGRLGRMWAAQRAVSRIPREEYDSILGFIRCPDFDLFRAGGGCHAAWLESHRPRLADRVELRLDREAVQTAGVVVINSELAGADLCRHYAVDRQKLRLVRNGVDLQRFRPRRDVAVGEKRKRIGFLGSSFRRKGLDACLRALVHLPGVQLQIAGRDGSQRRFAKLAHGLGVGDRVQFLGGIEHPEKWLCTLGAMVLPTLYDPCANACLEAMSCGIPVVTTTRNGASELLPEAWMALGLDEDEQALAETVERALQTEGLGTRCRDAMERWPRDKAMQELMLVVEEQAG